MNLENYLLVGTIVGTRGLDGTFKVVSSSYFAPIRYQKGNKLFLYSKEKDELIEVTVSRFYQEKNLDFVTFNEINNLDLSSQYKSYSILVSKDSLPPLEDDVYYFSDLVNLNVYTEEGTFLGIVKEVSDSTGQVNLTIINDKKSFKVPFVEFFIKKVLLNEKKIIIHVIEGLI